MIDHPNLHELYMCTIPRCAHCLSVALIPSPPFLPLKPFHPGAIALAAWCSRCLLWPCAHMTHFTKNALPPVVSFRARSWKSDWGSKECTKERYVGRKAGMGWGVNLDGGHQLKAWNSAVCGLYMQHRGGVG